MGERSLQDIINLLKTTDPDDVPAFVAKQLDKLPPVTFDHVDVTRLLKDITALKAGLAEVLLKLEISESTVSELRTELLKLKSNNSVSRSPEFNNINTRRGAQNASISSLSSPVIAEVRVAARPPAYFAAPPAPMTSSASTVTIPPRAYAAAAAAAPAVDVTAPAPPIKRPSNKGKRKTRSESAGKQMPPQASKKIECDDEGFIKVEKKKKRPSSHNLCGSASTELDCLLRPAVPTTQLYVSRLHWSTKVEDVVGYLQKKSNFNLRVERLRSRHKTNFSSFVVRVPAHHLAMFMKEDFWPRDVVFRRFRGRLPTDTAHTSPTLRVT